MLRLLVLVLLVLLIWVLLSALLTWLRATAAASRSPSARRNRGASGPGPAERLLRCATCGVRVPESRALPAAHRGHAGGDAAWQAGGHAADGVAYCSEACRRQAMRDSA